MADENRIRICFVPMCPNTSKSTPQKVFLDIPQDPILRDKWFRAVGRYNQGLTSNYFCCEDHFDFQDDLENFYEIKDGTMMIKDDVIPHRRKIKKQSMADLRKQILRRRNQEIIKLRKKIYESRLKDNNAPSMKQDIQDKQGPSSPVPSTSKSFGNLQSNTSNDSGSKIPIIFPKAWPKNTASKQTNSKRHFKPTRQNIYRLLMIHDKKRLELEQVRIDTMKALVLSISLSNNTVVDAINGLRRDLVQIREVLGNRYWAVRN